MTTLKDFGYTEKTVQVRTLDMANIVLTTAQFLILAEYQDIEIRVVDTFTAETNVFKNVNEFITYHWSVNYEVNLYSWGLMHDNKTGKDYYKIIIADEL